jgi:hypothetical protein
MIARLLRILGGALLSFCAATVIAECVLTAYMARALHVDRRRLTQAVAVLRGVDLSIAKEVRSKEPETSTEQASYEQILEARAIKTRDLEIREQALKSAVDQLRSEQGRLADEKDGFEKRKTAFEENLAAIKKQTLDAGWEENRNTLLALKPKKAKELILQMLDKNESEEVVGLLGPMPEARVAKIIGEFKTAEEIKQIDEILRRIRHGEPITDATQRVQQQLGAAAKEGAQ